MESGGYGRNRLTIQVEKLQIEIAGEAGREKKTCSEKFHTL